MIARIVAGFPGTGKSFCATQTNKKILDSDSSKFSWLAKNERNPVFPINYIEHIQQNLEKADIILVSTHDIVRKALVDAGLLFTLVYPSIDQREEYTNRVKERGSPKAFVKMLDEKFESFIKELEKQENCEHIVLKPGQYLAHVI